MYRYPCNDTHLGGKRHCDSKMSSSRTQTQCPWPGLDPGLLDLKMSAPTMRPLCIHMWGWKMLQHLIIFCNKKVPFLWVGGGGRGLTKTVPRGKLHSVRGSDRKHKPPVPPSPHRILSYSNPLWLSLYNSNSLALYGPVGWLEQSCRNAHDCFPCQKQCNTGQ